MSSFSNLQIHCHLKVSYLCARIFSKSTQQKSCLHAVQREVTSSDAGYADHTSRGHILNEANDGVAMATKTARRENNQTCAHTHTHTEEFQPTRALKYTLQDHCKPDLCPAISVHFMLSEGDNKQIETSVTSCARRTHRTWEDSERSCLSHVWKIT
ncbi:unnamed protein product [Leuciscus chuanchicus]